MTAILIIHILIALAGITLSFTAVFKPSRLLIRLSYGAVATTLLSGTYLVVIGAGQLTASCISGLLYIIVVSAGLIPARNRLARQEQI